jgi:hypothetical protein
VVIPLLIPGKLALAKEDLWPKTIVAGQSIIVVYQPQYQSLENDLLRVQGVVSLKSSGDSEPVFGAVWMDIHLEIDQEKQTARFVSAQVSDLRFPQNSTQQIADLPAILNQEFSQWDLSTDLQSLNSQLNLAQIRRKTSESLNFLPPKIIFRSQPTKLISFDGDPEWRPIQQSRLMRAVNTPSLVVFDPQSKSFYFDGGHSWLIAKELTGPWKNTLKVPEEIKNLQVPDSEQRSSRPASFNTWRFNQVLVATEPTELIVTQGEPNYRLLEGNDLLYMSNTESDVLLEIQSQRYYVLLSGRWYSSWALDGPWTFEPSNQLPESFSKISPSSQKAHLLVHIAGSQQAQEAFREAQIPKMASIQRQDARLHILYDGEPKFVPIEGTVLQYAVNAEVPVLELNRHFYAVKDGVWYESENPQGPWILSDSIPDEIQSLPPDCPVYHVKFVRVYDSTPDQVLVGYTPGYLGSYIFYGSLVYGTGYHYHPWYGHYSFFWPWTWGLRVHYSLGYGWSFGFRFGFGNNYFSHRHIYYHDHHHTILRYGHGGWWGPTRVRSHRGHLRNAGTDKQYRSFREFPRHRGIRPKHYERKNYFSDQRGRRQAALDRGSTEPNSGAVLSHVPKRHKNKTRSLRDRFNRHDRIGPEGDVDFQKNLRDKRIPKLREKKSPSRKSFSKERRRDRTGNLNRSLPHGNPNRNFNKEFRRHRGPFDGRIQSPSGHNSPRLKSQPSRKGPGRSFSGEAGRSFKNSKRFSSPPSHRTFKGNMGRHQGSPGGGKSFNRGKGRRHR